MKTKALLSVFFPLWGNELLAYPSLFFTDEEIKAIHEKQLDEKPHSLMLHLSALIYMDENNWCLWVNQKLIHPETCRDIDGFHLLSVMPHEVTFSWVPQDGTTPKTFTLRPSQTYITKDQNIVDAEK